MSVSNKELPEHVEIALDPSQAISEFGVFPGHVAEIHGELCVDGPGLGHDKASRGQERRPVVFRKTWCHQSTSSPVVGRRLQRKGGRR